MILFNAKYEAFIAPLGVATEAEPNKVGKVDDIVPATPSKLLYVKAAIVPPTVLSGTLLKVASKLVP